MGVVRPLRWAVPLSLAAAGAGWTWVCAHRGFFGFDQSIVFDAGYRVLQGQVPYRTLLLPTGPLLPWLQGTAFRLLGVSWGGYAALAALEAAVGTLVAWSLLRRWGALAAWVGGLGTAVWLTAPFGTPWFEPTGHLFLLLGLWGLVAGGTWGRLGAGVALGLSALVKQTIGAEAILLALLAWPSLERRERRALLGGFLLVAGAFAAWLFLASDPGRFLQDVLLRPSGLGRHRMGGRLVYKAGALLLRFPELLPVHLVLAAGFFLGLRGWILRRRDRRGPLMVGLAVGAAWEALVTENHAVVAYGLAGVLAGLLLASSLRSGWARWVGLVLTAAVLVSGLDAGWGRVAQDPVARQPLGPPLQLPGLRGLRWQERSPWPGPSAQEMVSLIRWLRARGQPFFVWPDHTILYGLCRVPSPQPLLWFHRGLTYRLGGDPALEDRILRALARAGIRTVVFEEPSWHGTETRLADFPRLRDWLRGLKPVARFGPFTVLQGDPPAP
jgi:hypothetical protein